VIQELGRGLFVRWGLNKLLVVVVMVVDVLLLTGKPGNKY
jgi:hypothetical protein